MLSTYRTSAGTIMVRTGHEGPAHDPYSFTEYTVRRRGHRTATLHLGLGAWSRIAGRGKLRRYNEARDVARFERACGYTLAQIDKAITLADRNRWRHMTDDDRWAMQADYALARWAE